MVAGRHAGHAARERAGVEVEHHRERAPRLEAAGPLEELLLQPHLGGGADGTAERFVLDPADRRGDDVLGDACAVGPDGVDGRIRHGRGERTYSVIRA